MRRRAILGVGVGAPLDGVFGTAIVPPAPAAITPRAHRAASVAGGAAAHEGKALGSGESRHGRGAPHGAHHAGHHGEQRSEHNEHLTVLVRGIRGTYVAPPLFATQTTD
jgi:hypothetical protein